MKHLKFLSVLFILAILASACATATPQTVIQTVEVPVVNTQVVKETQVVKQVETQVVNVPAETTTVTLSGWASSPAETALYLQLVNNFMVANPGIIVNYQPITGDYAQTMLTNFSAGTVPDIFYVDVSVFQVWAANAVLLPLDDLMATTSTTKDMFVPSLLDAFTYDGKIMGIPKDFNTLGLFYNTDMFDAANLAYPTDTWTWDDLKSAAKALTNLTDTKNPVYGFCAAADAGRFPAYVFQNGGTIMTPDFSDTNLDSQAAIDAATYYTSFRAEKIGAIPADFGEGWQGTDFGKGQCAMVNEGGWLIPYLAQSFPNLKYGVARLPAGPSGKGNMIFTVSWSISATTKYPDAAWKVVEFLTNEASQTQVLESGLALPSRASLQNSDYLTKNAAQAAIFNGSFDNAVPFYWGPAGSDVNKEIGDALTRVYLENQSPADAMKLAATNVRAAIAALK
jgi:multiple sugar transport system substrate-binding protein